jgi:hypothetical protein
VFTSACTTVAVFAASGHHSCNCRKWRPFGESSRMQQQQQKQRCTHATLMQRTGSPAVPYPQTLPWYKPKRRGRKPQQLSKPAAPQQQRQHQQEGAKEQPVRAAAVKMNWQRMVFCRGHFRIAREDQRGPAALAAAVTSCCAAVEQGKGSVTAAGSAAAAPELLVRQQHLQQRQEFQRECFGPSWRG